MRKYIGAFAMGVLAMVTGVAQAQDAVDINASPFGSVIVKPEEVAKLESPKLAFTPSLVDAQNYDKYYYFHRADTDFATAYADISECDGYARGLTSTFRDAPILYPYNFANAVGGAIGNAMVAAIFVPGEKRRMRRVNMRQCMGFKGYGRYGLSKDLWETFNFEEGTGAEAAESREKALRLQALVASSPMADSKELPL